MVSKNQLFYTNTLCNGKEKIYITPAHLYKNFWFAPQKNNIFSLVLLVWTGSFETITTIINSDINDVRTLWKGGECRSGRPRNGRCFHRLCYRSWCSKGVLNKSAISDVHSDLEIDERDDELVLLDPLTLPLHAFPNCGSIK